MTTIAEDLSTIDVFAGLSATDIDRLAGCGERRSFGPDEIILRAEQPVDAFHAIGSGRVAVEVDSPTGGPLVIETIGAGGTLGVSWLLPPYRWTFGARAVEPTTTIALDAGAVRALCDDDPTFGYELYKRFGALVHERLVSSRIRLLDLYGPRPS